MTLNTFKIQYLFLFFLCFLYSTIQSQTRQIDSIEISLSNYNKYDSVRVQLLNDRAYSFYNKNLDSLRDYALEANKLAKANKYIKGEARSLYILSLFLIQKDQLDEAIQSANESIKLYSIDKDLIKYTSFPYEALAKIFSRKRDFDKSKLYYEKALKIAIDHNVFAQEANIYNNLGSLHKSISDYPKAITYFEKSIELNNKLNKPDKTTAPLNNISAIYSNQGKFLEAISNIKKCLEINKKHNNKNEIAINLMNLGNYYSKIEKHKESIIYMEESLVLFKELNKKREASYALINLGNTHQLIGHFKTALQLFNEATTICKNRKDDYGLYFCYYNLGHVNFELQNYKLSEKQYTNALELNKKLGDDKYSRCESLIAIAEVYLKQNKNTRALINLNEATKIAKELNLTDKQKESHHLLSKLYDKQGNYKKAYENHLAFKTLSDSLFNKETIAKISKLEAEYKYKQTIESANKREIKLTQKVKVTNDNLEKSQKNFFIGIIVFLISSILLLGGLFFFRIRHIKAKNENILTEQKLLRSQMTPHFIFNSLAVLQGIILNKEERKSISYLSKFSKLLRIILENSREGIVPLTEEFKALENYLSLQNIHNSDTPYQYSINIDTSVEKDKLFIPPMLIQPFIENAIEHAFINKRENKIIEINLNFTNNKLICTIVDNGIGINTYEKEDNDNKKSLATIITSERLEILSKKYKSKGEISIEDRKKYNEKGTIVTINIPYKLKNND